MFEYWHLGRKKALWGLNSLGEVSPGRETPDEGRKVAGNLGRITLGDGSNLQERCALLWVVQAEYARGPLLNQKRNVLDIALLVAFRILPYPWASTILNIRLPCKCPTYK